MRHRRFFPFDDPGYRRPLREVVYRGVRIRARPYYIVLRWCVRRPFHRLRTWADARRGLDGGR
ncbi:hypothetical protein [Actinorugispora endophytica]|uniref:Uncharacterized protein n=1 Tax=Actinorugispora endophytica TaxID=1605990 RepID=A0A4R6V4L5_9ACTN|nr:hypothetical protein [Actinorugispora endophytica]TDQ55355.1 hypothetical protein EV190_101681 [Actinorugispora endophytica]